MYRNDYFSMPPGGYGDIHSQKFFTIEQSDIDIIKTLKSTTDESSYYDESPRVVWKLVDNPQVSGIEEFSRIFVCMQFISMIGKVNPIHNLEPYHKDLLRSLYLDFDDFDADTSIAMGYKRPFGNSFIIGDVSEVLQRYKIVPEDEEDDDGEYKERSYDIENKVFSEFIDFLPKFFRDFEMEYKSFVFNYGGRSMNWGPSVNWELVENFDGQHSYLRDWTLDPSYLRDEKLDKILS